jgi:hypothetical protein
MSRLKSRVSTRKEKYSSGDNIAMKARVVIEHYKMMYNACIRFIGDDIFKGKCDYKKIIKAWSISEIKRLFDMIMKDERIKSTDQF